MCCGVIQINQKEGDNLNSYYVRLWVQDASLRDIEIEEVVIQEVVVSENGRISTRPAHRSMCLQ